MEARSNAEAAAGHSGQRGERRGAGHRVLVNLWVGLGLVACSGGHTNPTFETGQVASETSADSSTTETTDGGPLTTGISASGDDTSDDPTGDETSVTAGGETDSYATSTSAGSTDASTGDESTTAVTSQGSTSNDTGDSSTTALSTGGESSSGGLASTTGSTTAGSSGSSGGSSGSSSSGGMMDGGQPETGMYAHCIMGMFDNCIDGATTCLYTTDPDDGFCTASACMNPEVACDPAPADATAIPICMTGDGVAFCALDCSGGLTCPADMICLQNLTLDGGMTTWDVCV